MKKHPLRDLHPTAATLLILLLQVINGITIQSCKNYYTDDSKIGGGLLYVWIRYADMLCRHSSFQSRLLLVSI